MLEIEIFYTPCLVIFFNAIFENPKDDPVCL